MSTDPGQASPEEQVTPSTEETVSIGSPEDSTHDESATSAESIPQKRTIKIGSQRESDSSADGSKNRVQPVPKAKKTFASEEQREELESPKEYPPPRLEKISDELQKEIDDALGGASIEDIFAGKSPTEETSELEIETRRTASVVKVFRDNVFFSLGGPHEGVVPLRQFEEPPELGTMLEVEIRGYDPTEGLYDLSIPGASVDVEDWSDVSEGMIVEALITGHNKGGLECEVNRLRGFIPASQISIYRVENFDEFVGQKLLCVITEANPQKKNLVLSRRATLEREREESRQNLLNEMEVGQIREGVVSNLRDFGAFVDIGGVDGLIHVSRMSWDRIKHPSEVLEEGEKVKVKIEIIDPSTGKIGLSLRDLSENPWDQVESKYPSGAIVTGKVSKIAEFGAFVKLEPGIEGLIHVSELSHGRVFKVSNFVSEDQELEVKVISVDPENQRISLSLKAAQAAPPSKDGEEGSEESSESDAEAVEVKPVLPKHKGPLKGGLERPSGGEGFGLKW